MLKRAVICGCLVAAAVLLIFSSANTLLAADWLLEPVAAPFSQSATSSMIAAAGSPGMEDFIFSGAATYHIPISVPPGRLGIAPKLSLNYNSQYSSGMSGVGWSMDPGCIQRSTAFGVNYGGSDFIYVKDGSNTQLVRIGATNEYRAKIDDGSRLRFIYENGYWIVYDKSGMTLPRKSRHSERLVTIDKQGGESDGDKERSQVAQQRV